MRPQAVAGMTTGATVMFFFGAIWLLVGFLRGHRPSPAWLRIAVLTFGIVLAAATGMMWSRVSRLAHSSPPPTSAELAVGRQIGHRFGLISGAEGAAIFIAVLLLNLTRRADYILPAIALIVGVHFLPLASLFGAPLYYATGGLGICVGTSGLFIRDPPLRSSIVGMSFGLLLWLTCGTVLVQLALIA